MREIKFRARGVDGEWWYGSLTPDALVHRQIHLGKFFTLLKEGALLPETVVEHTGLKDKNGVEIYEGDIVLMIALDRERITCEVVWDERKAQYRLNPRISWGSYLSNAWDLQRPFEVIGNIYENPELLTKGG